MNHHSHHISARHDASSTLPAFATYQVKPFNPCTPKNLLRTVLVFETVSCTSRTSNVLQDQPIEKYSPPGRSHNTNTLHRYQTMPRKKNLQLLNTETYPSTTRCEICQVVVAVFRCTQSTDRPTTTLWRLQTETPNTELFPYRMVIFGDKNRQETHTQTSNDKTEVPTSEKRLKPCSTQGKFLLAIGQHESLKRRESHKGRGAQGRREEEKKGCLLLKVCARRVMYRESK